MDPHGELFQCLKPVTGYGRSPTPPVTHKLHINRSLTLQFWKYSPLGLLHYQFKTAKIQSNIWITNASFCLLLCSHSALPEFLRWVQSHNWSSRNAAKLFQQHQSFPSLPTLIVAFFFPPFVMYFFFCWIIQLIGWHLSAGELCSLMREAACQLFIFLVLWLQTQHR